MKDLRAYILDLGYGIADGNFFESGVTTATIFDENPVVKWAKTPFYAILIDHPTAGYILYDTGSIPAKDWPDGLKACVKVTNDGDLNLADQLAKINVKLEDIQHIILSHFHIDHAGGLLAFKELPTLYVNRHEAESAYTTVLGTNDVGVHGFCYKPSIILEAKKVVYLDEDEELFEGVHVVNLRGHTAGITGLVLELESGNVLVTSDATNMRSNYEGLPGGIILDSIAATQSLKELHKLEKQFNCRDVWFSHDEKQFAEMKKVPEAY
ncbi:MAG: N-acyl homoserine lactonase family protein [Erysipelotrichaceae bacterium]|nr:N-acyl homoserine lactonase family protein [Erysipelotrichaceae bacterium]